MQPCQHTEHNHQLCSIDALATAEQLCRANRLRFTGLRRRVLELIWQSHKPVKAYELLDILKAEDASAKPPTVYRTLDFLLENGFIHRLNSLSAYIGCGHPHQHRDCYFLICSACGEITECCSVQLTNLVHKTAESAEFMLQQVMVEVMGICKQCKGTR